MPHAAHAWGSCFYVCDLCPSAIHSHLGSAGGMGVCVGGVRVPELISCLQPHPLGSPFPGAREGSSYWVTCPKFVALFPTSHCL